jgi:hypothetical protein
MTSLPYFSPPAPPSYPPPLPPPPSRPYSCPRLLPTTPPPCTQVWWKPAEGSPLLFPLFPYALRQHDGCSVAFGAGARTSAGATCWDTCSSTTSGAPSSGHTVDTAMPFQFQTSDEMTVEMAAEHMPADPMTESETVNRRRVQCASMCARKGATLAAVWGSNREGSGDCDSTGSVTGSRHRQRYFCSCGSSEAWLEGGYAGRTDEEGVDVILPMNVDILPRQGRGQSLVQSTWRNVPWGECEGKGGMDIHENQGKGGNMGAASSGSGLAGLAAGGRCGASCRAAVFAFSCADHVREVAQDASL